MVPFLDWAIGAIVWALANVVYIGMRRKGIRGFGRFAAFWVGFPGTFTAMWLVDEGRPSGIDPPEADDDDLLLEVRRDRETRKLRRAGGDAEAADR